MQILLKVASGSHSGKEIKVSDEKFLIGRSETCQLRPKSESVSRKHCIIVRKDNRVLIQDLNSRNGTFVNGKRLPTDRAKVLKPGDRVKVASLELELVIEHGLNAPKKPEVAGVADAAARVVDSGSSDSKFEDVDVDSWLDEADQIDRVRKISDPETRQFSIDALPKAESEPDSSDGDLSVNTEVSEDDSDDSVVKAKKAGKSKSKPGKIPERMKKALTDNSRDAADNALKRFFGGGG
ncbi:FHA domain-containing protein [bacterium]|nr:FHA domain-containing protein [bacterium]